MRHLWEIRRDLPENLHLRLLRLHAELSCDRCGWWQLWPLRSADSEEILAAAQKHFCPPAG